jgi:hypothetical protein
MRPILSRTLLLAAALSALGGAILVAQSNKTPGQKMAEAATKLGSTFTKEQKEKALFGFDDEHRTTWYFTPVQENKKSLRKGLRMDTMSAEQKTLMLDLLKLGLSAKGYTQASEIMGLEILLAQLEGDTGAMMRDPTWYFVSIFGEPSNTGKWGWRIEGHHLSVNFTLDKGEVISATPIVFGVNPAEIKEGPKKGQRVVPEVEDAAKELIASLTADQKKVAAQAKQFAEIREKFPDAAVGNPVGIPAQDLTADQKKVLRKLVEAYANRLPADLAAVELKKVDAADFSKVHFAYCIEEKKEGKPYSYRVQGPSFVIEFLNVQADASKNPANHIHSGWRSLPKDFALGAK